MVMLIAQFVSSVKSIMMVGMIMGKKEDQNAKYGQYFENVTGDLKFSFHHNKTPKLTEIVKIVVYSNLGDLRSNRAWPYNMCNFDSYYF